MLVSATLDHNDLNFRSQGEFVDGLVYKLSEPLLFGHCLGFTGTPNDFCKGVLAKTRTFDQFRLCDLSLLLALLQSATTRW